MNRRRTVDASTLLDLNWSTNHFPLPPPDGASPIRPTRNTTSSTSTALPAISPMPPRRNSLTHSTPQVQLQQCAETPPRQNLVVSMTTEEDDEEDDEDEEDIAAPISPRGAPDGRVEIEHNEQAADSNAVAARIMRPSLSSRPGSLGGGRTETEDDEDSSSDEDDRSDVSDIEIREEEQDPFSTSTGLPKTFNLSLSYEDRFEAYVYDILGNATVDQVHRLFKGYMEENILPNGWLGIWRSGGVFGSAPLGECTASVMVEIENVVIVADEEKLEAVASVSLPGKKNDDGDDNDGEREFRGVVVNHPGSPNSSIFNNSWSNPRDSVASSVETLTMTAVEAALEAREWNVPLLDVHPVFQRHGGAKLTATALEHVRFFYKRIWRAWDSDIAKDEPYASQCLQSRMALHYDLEEGKVNPEDQEKYEKTVSQYQDVRTQLKALHNSMDVSDSENELDEADVAQCAALYEREMALETAIQALENPLLRFLQHDTNFSKMKRQLAQRMRGETCESLTHVVAKVFRAKMAACLDPDAIVEHHPTLTSAMENFCKGDVIHVHEGIYSAVSLRSTPSGTVIRGQVPNSASPGPKRRPVQVSESIDTESESDEQKENRNDQENNSEKSSQSNKESTEILTQSTTQPSIELQVAFNSNVLIDVDPESGPVLISNLALRHLTSGPDGASRSQEPSPSRGGGINGAGDSNAAREELICVKRGTLVLEHVALLVNGEVGISVREGASLKMKDCVVSGARGAAVVAHPSAVTEFEGVKYVDCGKEVVKTVNLGHSTAVAAAVEATVEG